jgi:hypothetical protein
VEIRLPRLIRLAAVTYISNQGELAAMSEYESGTFRCTDCAKEFLTKEDADRHHREAHSDVEVGE